MNTPLIGCDPCRFNTWIPHTVVRPTWVSSNRRVNVRESMGLTTLCEIYFQNVVPTWITPNKKVNVRES